MSGRFVKLSSIIASFFRARVNAQLQNVQLTLCVPVFTLSCFGTTTVTASPMLGSTLLLSYTAVALALKPSCKPTRAALYPAGPRNRAAFAA